MVKLSGTCFPFFHVYITILFQKEDASKVNVPDISKSKLRRWRLMNLVNVAIETMQPCTSYQVQSDELCYSLWRVSNATIKANGA